MRPDKRKSAPAPLQLHSIRRREESTRVEEPVDVEDADTFSSAHIPAVGKEFTYGASSPEKEVSTPSSPGSAKSTPSSPGSAKSTPLPTPRPTASTPTVTVTHTVKGPTVTATALPQISTSSHTILSSTQSEALIPSTSSTTGATTSKAVIPIKAVGFVAGITGVAGALIAIGLFIFFWRRRRAARAAAVGGREGGRGGE